MVNRRDALKAMGTFAGAWVMPPQLSAGAAAYARIVIVRDCADTPKTRLAVRELQAGLLALGLTTDVVESNEARAGREPHILLRIDTQSLHGEAHDAHLSAGVLVLRAANELGLLYAVFDFLERQGMTHGIDGSVAPIDRPGKLLLPAVGHGWQSAPRFTTRGLLPWPDFLNCISVYNEEDFKAYFAAMLRMRLNMFGMHVYTAEEPTESYLSFDFAGVGHQAGLENTSTKGWGYLPQRTSTYKMGAAQFYDGEVFGADAARFATDNWDIANRTTVLMRKAFEFAHDLGIKTGIGFEPYKLPAAISQALPPEAVAHPGGFAESRTAKKLLERRLADLLERYPSVDHVWLWEDETSNWDSRGKRVEISTTAFTQAHDFLRRNAPGKRLVVAGWGGVTRNFQFLHEKLPGDVVFAALSDSLGWDPVNEAFGKLGDRERWPILWLEDDPSMWFPQFRASRFEIDMRRADELRCQGVLGIHWRHRIVDPTATYFASAGWNASLKAVDHYARFAKSQASGGRAGKLARLFIDCDLGRKIASTYTSRTNDQGFAEHIEIAADYNEAFNYRSNEPNASLLDSQRLVAEQVHALARSASSPLECERLNYLAGSIGLTVPYCDAYVNAHKLEGVLARAAALRKDGNEAEAGRIVAEEGVPLWTALAAQIRAAVLEFQFIVSTRNDLGQLASMQNKVVRIALERLKLSLQEFLGDLPASAEQAYADAIAENSSASPRVFLPTRPSLLIAGEALRLFIVCPGIPENASISFLVRSSGTDQWKSIPVAHDGRSVYSALLGPFSGNSGRIEYRAEIRSVSGVLSAPPAGAYSATILDR